MAVMICKMCGATLNYEEGTRVVECKFCGSRHTIPNLNKEDMAAGQSGGPNTSSLLDRGYISLEDGDWGNAAELFEQALAIDPRCSEAYLGVAMGHLGCKTKEEFETWCINNEPLTGAAEKALRRARQFQHSGLAEWFDDLEKRKQEQREKTIRFLAGRRKTLSPVAGRLTANLGVRADGTVAVVAYSAEAPWYGGQYEVKDWRNIAAVSTGAFHTVGLKTDGTVIATKIYKKAQVEDTGQSEVGNWRDITAVSAGTYHTVGLKADGTVVATPYRGDARNDYGQCAVGGWKDIIAVSAGSTYTVGVKADGTVVTTKNPKWTADQFNMGQCDVEDWRNIVAISAGTHHTVGLTADGTVVATPYRGNSELHCGLCEVGNWRNIVAVSAGANHTVGLKADGTVVATEYLENRELNLGQYRYRGQCDVSSWEDAVAVFATQYQTLGLKTDGTILFTVIRQPDAEVYVYDTGVQMCRWKLFDSIDSLTKKQADGGKSKESQTEKEWSEEDERQARIQVLKLRKASTLRDLSRLKGLFSGKRRKELEERLAYIEEKLSQLTRQ